jgi:hypothetical protein
MRQVTPSYVTFHMREVTWSEAGEARFEPTQTQKLGICASYFSRICNHEMNMRFAEDRESEMYPHLGQTQATR